jgi:transcriptional regulator with XRE-family HTH domain/tetratricopeptide (TPR) repeat protein
MTASEARDGASRARNRVLRSIREARGESRAEFAEAMARVAHEIGEKAYPDAKYVQRLESGEITWPGPVYRDILVRLCGRPAAELGFTPPISRTPGSRKLPADVNAALRDAIWAGGMEVAEFARRIAVDPKTVERWITHRRIPHSHHRWKAAQILGRDESHLWPESVSGKGFPVGESSASGNSVRHGFSGVHPGSSSADIAPVLRNMSQASTAPVIAALREVRNGYVLADRLMGGLSVSDAVRTQVPIVERACEVTRGKDRAEALDFACRFMEFCGWIHQDAGDLACAMFWTDRALDYAMELGDQRTIAYTLMRKSAIATETGNPAQGLGIASFALKNQDSLTPRLRAVILRQRAHANAALREISTAERDADHALSEAAAGVSQEEEDRAPYCSPTYIAMETGQSMSVAGRSEIAVPVLARSRAEWSDGSQARDYALCVSRLAAAYATAGDLERACETAQEAIGIAYGIGSHRVISQLGLLSGMLAGWRSDSRAVATHERLSALVGSFQK